ncbi:MAG TPA: FtsX-like permease family protein, partial [Vicinamibacteria bacterium]|nr:FtsX-like permease family protein [Vicinamibacteria bacterium]
GPPASYANAVRSAVWSADPAVAIAALRPLRSLVGDDLGRPRMLATLLLAFSAVGLLIVLCGVYGVVAYSVRRREREIAIRLALGATPQSVARLVLGKGLRYAALALVAGVPAALAAGGLVRGLLFGVEPSDPAAFATLTAVVVLTTVAATLVPAARAGRVEPAAVLKGE